MARTSSKKTSKATRSGKKRELVQHDEFIRRYIGSDGKWTSRALTKKEKKEMEASEQTAQERIKQRAEMLRPLTDGEWQIIASTGRLPVEARTDVQAAINRFRGADTEPLPTASEAREQLETIKNAAACLLHNFRWMDIHTMHLLWNSDNNAEWPAIIKHHGDLLRWFEGLYAWFKRADESIPHKRISDRIYRIYRLVIDLDEILLRYTNKQINRAKKRDYTVRYVRAVLDIVASTTTDDAMDAAIKYCMTMRNYSLRKNT